MTLPPKDRKKILLIGASMMMCIAGILAIEIWHGSSLYFTQNTKSTSISQNNQRDAAPKRLAKRKLSKRSGKATIRQRSSNKPVVRKKTRAASYSTSTNFAQTKIKLNTRSLFITKTQTLRTARSVKVSFDLNNRLTTKQASGSIYGKATFMLNGKKMTVRNTLSDPATPIRFKLQRLVHKALEFTVPLNADSVNINVYVNSTDSRQQISRKPGRTKKRSSAKRVY